MLTDFFSKHTSQGATARNAAPPAAHGFQPLLAPGALTPTTTLGRTREPLESEAAHARETPEIEVIQENGKIRRIVVTCKCCERIELECEY
jgi:hypothetical protein